MGIDIALAGLPFEERAFSRATYLEYFPGISLLTCSAEDLVVYKAFAVRGTDWDDLEAMIIRQGERLNRALITEALGVLAEPKEAPEIMDRPSRLFCLYPPH